MPPDAVAEASLGAAFPARDDGIAGVVVGAAGAEERLEIPTPQRVHFRNAAATAGEEDVPVGHVRLLSVGRGVVEGGGFGTFVGFADRRTARRCGVGLELGIQDTRFPSAQAGSTAWRCVRRGRSDMCGAPGAGKMGGPNGWGTPRPSRCMAC